MIYSGCPWQILKTSVNDLRRMIILFPSAKEVLYFSSESSYTAVLHSPEVTHFNEWIWGERSRMRGSRRPHVNGHNKCTDTWRGMSNDSQQKSRLKSTGKVERGRGRESRLKSGERADWTKRIETDRLRAAYLRSTDSRITAQHDPPVSVGEQR